MIKSTDSDRREGAGRRKAVLFSVDRPPFEKVYSYVCLCSPKFGSHCLCLGLVVLYRKQRFYFIFEPPGERCGVCMRSTISPRSDPASQISTEGRKSLNEPLDSTAGQAYFMPHSFLPSEVQKPSAKKTRIEFNQSTSL